MFKKILAAGAVIALFACSTNNEEKSNAGKEPGTPGSSQQGGNETSSSSGVSGPSVVTKIIANNGEYLSFFKTYHYVFSLKASANEDLTQFWKCSTEKQDTKPDLESCQLTDKRDADAMLQHNLTNQYSPLHYMLITTRINPLNKGATLKQWNLKGAGDEVALGLNVSENNETNDLKDEGITDFNNVISFEYKYIGGAHEFRISSKTEGDFWYYEVPATANNIVLSPVPEEEEYKTITIPIKDLKGMGSFAAGAGKGETPLDISQTSKFLWAVKYSAENAENNKNSLVIYDFKAYVEQ